jgi:hypothetical protein
MATTQQLTQAGLPDAPRGNGEADCPTRRHGGRDDPGGDHVHGIRSLPAPACGGKERWSMQLVSVGECLTFFFSIAVILYLWIQ